MYGRGKAIKAAVVLVEMLFSCARPSGMPAQSTDFDRDASNIFDLAEAQDTFGSKHANVFEQKVHSMCMRDGPWPSDTVEFVRTTDLLPVLQVTHIAVFGHYVVAVTPEGVFVRHTPNQPFEPFPMPIECDGAITVQSTTEGFLFACDQKAFEVTPAGSLLGGPWNSARPISKTIKCDGRILALASGALLDLVSGDTIAEKGARDVACVNGLPWIASDTGLWSSDDVLWWSPVYGVDLVTVVPSSLGLDSVFAASGDEVAFIVPEQGVQEIWRAEPLGMPAAPVTALAASEGLVGLAHPIGLSVLDLKSGRFEHFHSERWLPDENVHDIAFSPDGSIWAATAKGLARIFKTEIMLSEKAERMFEKLNRYHWRMDGFVSSGAYFPDPWSEGPPVLWDDDNDGQWTEEAVAAFCYAYAVTSDKRYLDAARKAVRNMLLLIDVPAKDFEAAGLGKGFVARSLVRDDEGEVFASKATQPNWHRVDYEDGHTYYWKDDTSSDEVTGHFFGLSLFYDLCAQTDEEKAWVASGITALADYILRHGFTLPDLDGKPTTHGDWSPAKIAIAVDGLEACVDQGYSLIDCLNAWGGGGFLDSIEILGAMLAAWHVSGDPRFFQAYETLYSDYRYGEVAMFNENVLTWTNRSFANYCDHELADLAFLTVLRYEPNPQRRERFIQSMLAAWSWELGERNPLKTLAMASAVYDVPGLAEGVQTLVDYPEDLRAFLFDNSHRMDVTRDVPDRFGEPQFTTVLPYDEIQTMRWDYNPYRIRGGGDGRMRLSPAFWLLPYWGLRYYNAICSDK